MSKITELEEEIKRKKMELDEEIAKRKRELKALTDAHVKFALPKFEHHCPYCGWTWMGRKAETVECVNCKRRLERALIEERQCKDACARLDEVIRSKGSVSKAYLYKLWTFTSKPDGIEYVKVEKGVETERKLVKGTYEILRSWDWQAFMQGLV